MTNVVADVGAEAVVLVPRARLIPCPLNPRTRFEEASLRELGASLREKGVIQPLLARRRVVDGIGWFEIVDGERRWRAAELAGVEELPVIERELSDSDVLEIAIVSAVQRQGLTPLEEAAGYRRLIDANPSHYSARYIADRIGRHEKYVWDRMKLLDLVDEAKQLLNDERILVGHAELLAKLKPEDQRRAIDPEDGGLFEREVARLEFDDGDDDGFDEFLDEDDTSGRLAPRYLAQFKPRTVRELETWIAKHVRFDVEHFAQSAPLDFGPVSDRVAEAAAKPGRGKKVISITHEYHIDDSAKADGERTYGPRSWRRADGQKGSEPCDHAILGVIVAGPDYGQAFNVCIARDKCETHWKEEIAAKKKAETLRAAGKTKQAAKTEKRTEQSWERQQRERDERQKAWKTLYADLRAEVASQVKSIKSLTPAHVKALAKYGYFDGFVDSATALLGASWYKNPAAAIIAAVVDPPVVGDTYAGDPFDIYVKETAKPLGLDIKRLEAVRDKHAAPAAAEKKPAAKAAPAKAKAAKKAAVKKSPANTRKKR